MGGSVSLNRKPVSVVHSEVFVSSALLEGSKQLRNDEVLRKSFVEYVKSGAWLDKIARYSSEQPLTGTKADPFGSGGAFRHSSSLPATPGTQRSQSAIHLDGSFKEKQEIAVLEGYVAITEESFTNAQICCFLFAVVLPIYLKSAAYKLHVMYGAQAAKHFEEDSVSVASAGAEQEKIQTPQSSRAQGILLGCAAFFDEAHMLEMLMSNWVDALSLSICSHALAISVVHRTKNEHPIVYVNRSFEALFPNNGESAVGQPMQSGTGRHKEQMKKARFDDAFKSQHCTNLFFPRYTSTSRCLLDGTAVQPVGEYALCAHFTTAPGDIDQEQWTVVEDVLAVLSCLVPEPAAAPTGTLGLPPVTAINTALPFYKRTVLSPVSARSPASGGGGGVSVRSSHSGSSASGSVRSVVSRGSERRSGILRSGYKSSSGSSRTGSGAGGVSSVHSFHSVVSTNSGGGSPRAVKVGVAGAAVVRKFAKSRTVATLIGCSASSSSSVDMSAGATIESTAAAPGSPVGGSQPQE